MFLLKQRWLSRWEMMLIFTAVLLPVQFWMLYNLAMAYPAYQFRLPAWDLLGFVAYQLAFALLESLLVFGGVAALALLAPLSWRGDRRVACASMLVFIVSFWSILVHLNYKWVIEWGGRQMMVGLLVVLATSSLSLWATARFHRLSKGVIGFLERAEVLAVFYLAIGLLSVLIVGMRNLFAGV